MNDEITKEPEPVNRREEQTLAERMDAVERTLDGISRDMDMIEDKIRTLEKRLPAGRPKKRGS